MTLRVGMGRREIGGGFRMGTHVHPWLINVSVWQKPLQYYKVINLQLIINEKTNNKQKRNEEKKLITGFCNKW